jgi:holo-[acyl-carrier protein] synthase
MDATEIDRIEAALATIRRPVFLRRVFTEGEIAYATRRRNPAPHLAGRFAAKERR